MRCVSKQSTNLGHSRPQSHSALASSNTIGSGKLYAAVAKIWLFAFSSPEPRCSVALAKRNAALGTRMGYLSLRAHARHNQTNMAELAEGGTEFGENIRTFGRNQNGG